MKITPLITSLAYSLLLAFACCSSDDVAPTPEPPADLNFYFGADLSYVNQLLDKGAVFKENFTQTDPYQIFDNNGTNLVRFRIWHNPLWTKTIYGGAGTQLYNDLYDVEKAIAKAKALGMEVLLDFHYSDTWTDPGKQYIPEAWLEITDVNVLADSIYNYTTKTLQYLNSKGLLPELVQIGNETNCGFLYTDAPTEFPNCNVCNGNWSNAGKIYNSAIDAVRDVTATTTIKTKVILHVADPKNIDWWFDDMKAKALVTDFDMIGFSYYPLWHTTIKVDELSTKLAAWKTKYNKDLIVLETAYPWTTAADDSYNNHFGDATALTGFPFSQQGQLDFMKKLCSEVIEGGGIGVIYWEPAWISSSMKDLWGTGSSWENCTFFDYDGNKHKGFDYMKYQYK